MALRFASAAAVRFPPSVSIAGEDKPRRPRLRCMAEPRFAFDCPAAFLPRFVETAELSQTNGEIVPLPPFTSHIADLDILVRRLTDECHRFFGSAQIVVIQDPQLCQRARLPNDISDPHRYRERFPVGILRRFRLSRLLINHSGLMPTHGDGARFVQPREPLARVFMSLQRLLVATLLQADGSKHAFSDGDAPVVTEFLRTADTLYASGRRFGEPAQAEKTLASFREAAARHSLRWFVGAFIRDGLAAFLRLV
jgi:hypothetical protein